MLYNIHNETYCQTFNSLSASRWPIFISTGKILTSKFQNCCYRYPFKLFWQLPPSNGSVNRVDGCDCVNSGRARGTRTRVLVDSINRTPFAGLTINSVRDRSRLNNETYKLKYREKYEFWIFSVIYRINYLID